MSNSTKTHCCVPCGYLCCSRSNLVKHFSSKKHVNKIQNPDAVIVGKFKCPNCVKTYKGNTGLWAHKKKCKAPEPVIETVPNIIPETDLHAKIDNLERIIVEMAKNQQPTTINNHINSNNNNYISIFLNDKCHNAYDIKKFIAGIDFSKENFERLIRDYVGGNAEIITKNYNSLPEYERPVYVFTGEDEHQKIAHIQYNNKWVVERELGWEKQVRREYNEETDEPVPNSMYSLIRLFDKKKMEYFDENYRQSHLYLSQRKFNKDCLDDGKQLELINKIIDTVSIEPE
jgi:hypothetical protein